jgi:carbamoyl-phosphate synthase large subunit
MRAIHVLMTGAGAPGAAGIIRCLQEDAGIQLTVADADNNAAGKYLVADFVQVPLGDDPSFIQELLRICTEKRITHVLPLVTRELLPLSRNVSVFREKKIHIMVSSPEAILLSNHKGNCYRFLQGAGIAVPEFRVVHTTEEFIHAAFELGHPDQPFCFKPAESNGSRGFRIIYDSLDESELLFKQKPWQTRITYAHALNLLSCKPFPELVVMEYLPGAEYSVDCVVEQGKPRIIIPRIREKTVNGISVQGTFVKDEAVISYCKDIIEAIGPDGNIGIQVKKSASGQPLLLEINPRVQGTIVAALGAGVNLPLLALQNQNGTGIEWNKLNIAWNTRFSRYWTEIFYK